MFRIKVIFRLLHFGFKSDMNFHFDFFCGLFSSILWIGLPIVFFRLIFLNIDYFNGWDYYQILFLVGSYTIVDGVMMGLLIRSMGILESDILSGNLDQILLRPFDTQLFYIFRSFNLVQFVNTFFGLAIMARVGVCTRPQESWALYLQVSALVPFIPTSQSASALACAAR